MIKYKLCYYKIFVLFAKNMHYTLKMSMFYDFKRKNRHHCLLVLKDKNTINHAAVVIIINSFL